MGGMGERGWLGVLCHLAQSDELKLLKHSMAMSETLRTREAWLARSLAWLQIRGTQ